MADRKDYPPTATLITYQAYGLGPRSYYVWAEGKNHFWYANANSGREDTRLLAEEAARRWIRDGVKGMERCG